MAMKKICINLRVDAKDSEGELLKTGNPPKNMTLARLVRNVLGQTSPKTTELIMKYFTWCGCISDEKDIEFDEADFETLKSAVLESNLLLCYKAPILSIMTEAKSEAEKAE